MSEDTEDRFELAGFRLEVLRRQFPDAVNDWDGNWLVVACECKAPGAQVYAKGPFVDLRTIDELARKLEALQQCRSQAEEIDFIEPELSMKFKAGARGDLEFDVSLTPDHLKQTHRFSFDIDLSYLPAAITQCRSILLAYPIRFAPMN